MHEKYVARRMQHTQLNRIKIIRFDAFKSSNLT